MSLILSIETSCERGSIALLRGDAASYELLNRPLPIGASTHSGALLPAIKTLLAEAGTRIAALDAVAFGKGPGAFTGVRLACGVAQGLALGADLPVAAICSLEALALPFAAQAKDIYCAIDARMSEIYLAMFKSCEGLVRRVSDIQCLPPDQVVVPTAGSWSGIGTAFTAYREHLVERFGERLQIVDAEAVPTAQSVAILAMRNAALWRDAADAAPEYVRNRVALTTAERLAQGGRA